MKSLPKTIPIVLALALAAGPAQSRSLHMTGTAGYLAELDGEIADAGQGAAANWSDSWSGSMSASVA
jgi:hypothetical protein